MKEINKKTKYENKKEKNFINLETIELRKNIHEETSFLANQSISSVVKIDI